MKHTKEEIINALKVIKEECKSHCECTKCPFYGNSIETTRACMFGRQRPPYEWGLNDTEPETWRAFK